ncbi:nucleoside-diphosphate sugar epimerase/dehydratase [uncultured Aureimonas sp.]|uniref:polysaccharide biosynthesis protein n=1 Tax=uncultured Aureimonas sp. TaxID=1604662 RepID=UPI0025E4A358|nr:nucleoside-diphosphate sugar epimerase/dehydratase [uncultured Aureimonas sp.]
MLPRLLSLLPRGSFRSLGIVHDVLIAAIAISLALGLAFGFRITFNNWQIWSLIVAFTALSAAMFPLFSLNSGAWRYASLLDVLSIVKAVTAINVVFLAGHFILFRGLYLPRSSLVMTWFIMIVGLGGPRLAYRLWKERGLSARFFDTSGIRVPVENVVIYGFTDNADLFIRDARRSHHGVHIVGLVDDKSKNQGRQLHGVKVLGALADLPEIARRAELGATPINQLIVAKAQVPPAELAAVVEVAAPLKIAVKRLPDISRAGDLGEAPIEVLPVSLEDLLGRREIRLDIDEVARLIEGRCIAVTGAGGSIGSELVAQIASFGPKRLVLIDAGEFNLYTIGRRMADQHPGVETVERVADVRQRARIMAIFDEWKPEVIFHAAALKHVPIVEENPLEGIETNLLGSRNVADAALGCGAAAFVMVSTDKAVNPTNVMGATKRAAEAYCQALDLGQAGTRFMTVRFGNVMGSAGSVIPLFQNQLSRGGPLTVTDPDITRFFMTIPEASRLILHAAGHGIADRAAEGQIFVLDMGEPIRITELAERLIQLAGLRPHKDIRIEYTGLRKGEKLYEELFGEGETREDTGLPGLLIARSRVSDVAFLRARFEAIAAAIAAGDTEAAIALLSDVVPEFGRSHLSNAALISPALPAPHPEA